MATMLFKKVLWATHPNIIHLTEFSHIYSVLLKIREKSLYFLNNMLFFKIFKTLKIFIIWYYGLIERLNFTLLLKTNRFYLLNCLRDSVSRKFLFLPKNGKTWRTSDVNYGRHIKPNEFSFCQDELNWWLGGYWKAGDDPCVTSEDIADKREGEK